MRKLLSFFVKYLYALCSCFYLFTGGILFRKNRTFIRTICTHFGWDNSKKCVERIIPEVEFVEMIPSSPPIRVQDPIAKDGEVSTVELIVINQFVQQLRPQRLFELGTFDGRTALNLASNAQEEARVYTLDLPREQLYLTKLPTLPDEKQHIDKERSGTSYLGTAEERKIIQLYGDSATFDFSPFCGTVDFVFIDASHSYEYAINDSWIALKLLRNRTGVILWHDYGEFEGVTRALNELYSTSTEFRNMKQIKETNLVCLMLKAA